MLLFASFGLGYTLTKMDWWSTEELAMTQRGALGVSRPFSSTPSRVVPAPTPHVEPNILMQAALC